MKFSEKQIRAIADSLRKANVDASDDKAIMRAASLFAESNLTRAQEVYLFSRIFDRKV